MRARALWPGDFITGSWTGVGCIVQMSTFCRPATPASPGQRTPNDESACCKGGPRSPQTVPGARPPKYFPAKRSRGLFVSGLAWAQTLFLESQCLNGATHLLRQRSGFLLFTCWRVLVERGTSCDRALRSAGNRQQGDVKHSRRQRIKAATSAEGLKWSPTLLTLWKE